MELNLHYTFIQIFIPYLLQKSLKFSYKFNANNLTLK